MTLSEKLKSNIQDISPAEIETLISKWNKRITLKRGDILFRAGQKDSNLYFVEKGAIKLCCENAEKEVIVEFGYSGSCIFDLSSYVTGQPSEYYAQALKSTTVLAITQNAFQDIMNSSSALSGFWKKNLEKNLMEMVQRQVDLLNDSPRARYDRLKERRPEVLQYIPQKLVAQYLGMSAETLCRLQKY